MTPSAFTYNSEERLNHIITPISIRQSSELAKIFGTNFVPVDTYALWDTGASASCISKSLANQLGLKSVEICYVSGVGGIHKSNVYTIDILLPNRVTVNGVRVTEFFDNGVFNVIIGMDIITIGDFAISNYGGKTTVSYRMPPDGSPIDFVAMINQKNKPGKPGGHLRSPPPPYAYEAGRPPP
jgi:hypothetical protein